ncbi:MAG: hypothetical protein ABIJ96_03415 [Elusimicrobiota bacterium]
MSEFLQKNRKKGAAAALLLLFTRGKGTVPLICMVGLLATVFVVPTDTILGLPVIGPLAKSLGLSSSASRGREMAEMAHAIDAARKQRYLQTPGALFGKDGRRAGSGGYGESTVGLVVGDKRYGGKGGGEGAGAGERDGAGDHDMIGQGDELEGADALNPDEAKDMENGVRLDNNDLIKSVGAGAKDGEGAGDSKPVADFENLKGYKGMSGGGGVSGGARPVNPDSGLLANTLSNNTNVPSTGRSGRAMSEGRTKQGTLRGRQYRKLNAAVSGNMGDRRGMGRQTAMYQLAEGRAYSIAAAPPPGKCDPGGGCPAEYAKNVAGTVYDGNEPAGGIITATDLGEAPNPNVPDQGTIDTLVDEAEQVEEDALKCEEANEKYGPLIDEKNAEIDAQSQELNNTNCDGGKCSKGKLRRCEEIEGRMKKTCGELNDLQRQWANACPLTDGKYDEMKCTR